MGFHGAVTWGRHASIKPSACGVSRSSLDSSHAVVVVVVEVDAAVGLDEAEGDVRSQPDAGGGKPGGGCRETALVQLKEVFSEEDDDYLRDVLVSCKHDVPAAMQAELFP